MCAAEAVKESYGDKAARGRATPPHERGGGRDRRDRHISRCRCTTTVSR